MADATAEVDRAAADIPLTRSARDILSRAFAIAAERGGTEPEPVDVLKAVLETRGTLVDKTLHSLGADPRTISALLLAPDASSDAPPTLRQLLVNANREAQVLGHYQVDSIHLLLAMLYSDSPATSRPLQSAGLTLYDLRRHVQEGPQPEVRAAMQPGGRAWPGSMAPPKARPDERLRRKPLPSLRGAIGVSPTFGGLVAATVVLGGILYFGPPATLVPILALLFVVAGWITSVCIHEFGHALVAYLGGDRSVVASGYLTLDPLKYTHVLLSVVIPIVFLLLGGIGLPGGAVYINHSAIRSKVWDSAVSVAGPAGTLVCLLLVAFPFMVPGHDAWITDKNLGFFEALAFLAFIEVIAILLNLLPIPGLDGFGILRPWLPYSAQDMAVRYGQLAIILVFVALWYVPPVQALFFGTAYNITNGLGVDLPLVLGGRLHMRLH